MGLYVKRITALDKLESVASEWEDIDSASFPRTPFTSPLWNLLWWRHFTEHRFWARDELFVLSVRDQDGALIALAPLVRTLRPGWGPLRTREIQFFGAGTDILELRGLICRPAYREAAMQVLQAHLKEHADEWDSLLWCGVPAGEPFASIGALPPYRTVTDHYLQLPDTWIELKAGLSRNMKEALRKCYNSLKREGHVFAFRTASKPEEVDAALDIFFDLHRARAELKGCVPHPDRFRPARSREFLRHYAREMARNNQLQIFQLEIDGNIVASRIGFVFGAELYLYYSGYSPDWGRFSIMTTLTVEAIKWAIGQRFRIVNLSTGSDYGKARWRPAETTCNDFLVWSPAIQRRFVRGRLFGMLRHAPPGSMLGRMVGIARRSQ